MTHSSYLRAAAARASIDISTLPPLVQPLPTLSTKSEVTFYDRRLPRSLKEAGLDHLSWDSRLAPPLEPWWRSFIGGIGIVIFIIAIFVVLGAFGQPARAQNIMWCAHPTVYGNGSATSLATPNPCQFEPSQSDVSAAPNATPVEAAMSICHEHGYWKAIKRDEKSATQVWTYPNDWRDCNAVYKKWQDAQDALSKKIAADAALAESRDKRYVTAVAQGRIP